MALTPDEVDKKIGGNLDVAALFDVVRNESGSIAGATPQNTYLLYSGQMANGEWSSEIAGALLKASRGKPTEALNVVHSDIGSLVSSAEFRSALVRAVKLEVLGDLNGVVPDDLKEMATRRLNALYNGKDGLDANAPRVEDADAIWDIASKKYVEATHGNFRVIAPGKIDPLSVFTQSELPALLDNPNVAEIDGLKRTDLATKRDESGLERAWKTIGSNSRHQIALSELSKNNPHAYLDLAGLQKKQVEDLEGQRHELDKQKHELKADLDGLKQDHPDSKVLSAKEHPLYGSRQGFGGVVVAESSLHTLQKIGARALIAHENSALVVKPQVGKSTQIAYDGRGKQVQPDQRAQEKARSLGR